MAYIKPEVQKVCEECGKPYAGHPQSKYCEVCRPIVKRRQQLESLERRRMYDEATPEELKPKPKPKKKRRQKVLSIAQVARLARAAGVSYGEYVRTHRV